MADIDRLIGSEHQGIDREMLACFYTAALSEGGTVDEINLRAIRAVLARYGIIPAPIPVSERLPGPEDCDTEGRCWFYTPASSVLYASWVLREPDSLRKWETHWLPAHALPLPEVNDD